MGKEVINCLLVRIQADTINTHFYSIGKYNPDLHSVTAYLHQESNILSRYRRIRRYARDARSRWTRLLHRISALIYHIPD